jgi:hypothetical protein
MTWMQVAEDKLIEPPVDMVRVKRLVWWNSIDCSGVYCGLLLLL